MIDLTYWVEADSLILRLKGRLDEKSALEAEQRIFELLQHKERRWIVDLEAVEHVSGAGLRVLLGLAKKLSARRNRLVLCSPQPEVNEALLVSGFNRVFRVVASLADALRVETTVSRPLASLIGGGSGIATTVAGLIGTSETLPPLLPASQVDRVADAILRLLESSGSRVDSPPGDQ